MPGFATATKTNRSAVITQFLNSNAYFNRYGRGTHRLAIEEQREAWDSHYIGRNTQEIDIEELFTPAETTVNSSELTNSAKTHAHLLNSELITTGFWALTVSYDPRIKMWDFTFQTKVGNLYQFHPKAIRHRIISQHGVAAYEKWKQLVISDWDSLMSLKSAWTPPTPMAASVACSPSAERLCKRMGFDVRSGVVFWFRD